MWTLTLRRCEVAVIDGYGGRHPKVVGEAKMLSSVVIAAAMKTSIRVVAERDISVLPTLNTRVLGFVAPNTPSPLPC